MSQDMENTQDLIFNQFEKLSEQLKEYFTWLDLPPRVNEMVDDLIMADVLSKADPEQWKDEEWVAQMRHFQGFEEATSSTLYLDEVADQTKRMADHLLWIAGEIDGLHQKKTGCLENCPIIRRLLESYVGFPNPN